MRMRYALLAILLALPLRAGAVNVKDFGAAGDGSTDDTAAILKAMKAAAIAVSKPSPAGVYFQAGPELVFPAGEYVISDEIPLEVLAVRGEGRAAIRQTNPKKAVFTSRYAWQLSIRDITFLGGKYHIDLYNPNIDTGQIIIKGCRFYGSESFAVRTDVISTTVKIEDCEFLLCGQAWYNNRCDQAVMRDCWITSRREMKEAAVIEHRGSRLTIENLCGVPLTGGPRQRWIDNYGFNLTLKQCRFGGEGGGFTPVYNFTRYASQLTGPTILFEDCFISANASYSANCAVYCLEIPNTIALRDCGMGGCEAVVLDKKIDPARYFENVSPDMLSYTLAGSTGERTARLPKGLLKPSVRIVPSDKPLLSPKETAKAMKKAGEEWSLKKTSPDGPDSFAGHARQTDPQRYIELTDWSASGLMDATSQKNADWLALGQSGDDRLVLFRQSSKGGWPHLTIRASADLARTPWLAWRQLQGTAPGSFALKVIDTETGAMHSLYGETFDRAYDYHAHNLKDLFGGGVKKLEIRWYPLGWGMKSPTETDYFWAQPGQYTVMDFFRLEE